MTAVLKDNLYPMNQDSIVMDNLNYSANIDWMSSFLLHCHRNSGMSIDALVAQFEKDLRMVLDQKFRPQ